ncbi:MAG: DUF4870 domain-containing protein [Candidatus Eremiobacteraeota bacterium]|nr:DUF4870 domain-containing protein [Candidatus Eremiobacteraeota bacterium]
MSREDRLLATLAYPFWYLVYPLIYMTPDKRNDPFLRHHAYHALFMGLGLWVGGILLHTGVAIIGKFFIVFGILLYPFVKLLGYAAIGLTAYAMLTAWQGKKLSLPYLSEFAEPFISEGAPRTEQED